MSKKRKKIIINFELDASKPVLTPEQKELVSLGQQLAIRGIDFSKELHIEEATVDMQIFKEKMADALLTLRLDFGKLKQAVEQAVAPLAAVFLPMVDRAIRAATKFARIVGLVLGAALGTDGLTGNLDAAAQEEKTLETNAKAAAKAVKRSLAGFDTVDRLASSGAAVQTGASATQQDAKTDEPVVLSAQMEAVAAKIRMIINQIGKMIGDLGKIDLSPLMQTLTAMGQAFSGFSSVVNSALGSVWEQVMLPLVTWIMEKLLPVLTMTSGTLLGLLSAAVSPLASGFFEPVGEHETHSQLHR